MASLPSTLDPASYPPQNISTRPHPDKIIYIDTTMAPPQQPQSQAPAQMQGQPNPDLAGVLRRNQACLNCRRRKLKCDAVRPHCGTCVRSHKHALRTAPKTNPVMMCDYDDEGGAGSTGGHATTSGVQVQQVEDEDEGERKRKRRVGSGGGKKKDEDDSSTVALMKRIQELEAQIKAQTLGPDTYRPPPPPVQAASAPSPTALLDLLSTTAAHASVSQPPAAMKDGAIDSMMMCGSTGLTPYMQTDEPQFEQGSTISSDSRRESEEASGQSSSTGQSILSPNGIFNFSPSPINPMTGGPLDPTKANDANVYWAAVNAKSMAIAPGMVELQPSTRVEGPWRGVETADNIFTGTGMHFDKDGVSMEQPPLYNPIPNVEPMPGNMGMGNNIDIEVEPVPAQEGFVMDEFLQQKILMDLFWPGWPPNLPEPNIVNDLIESFFDKVPALPRMLSRSRLLNRMTLPPTHQDFPHPSLLHAICACASLWCAPAVYSQSNMATNLFAKHVEQPASGAKFAKFSMDPPAPTFSSIQADLAKGCVQGGLDTGHKLFDIVRAIVILSRYFLDETRMLECWIYSGLATRMILPLGLNVRSAEFSLKSVMLPPAVDALEREERHATVWMAFYHDTIGSAASGWGSSLSIDDLTIPLPVAAKEFDMDLLDMPANPQDTESLDLWTRHPVVDPFVLCMKAVILLNRVTRFVRRWKNRRISDDDDLEGMRRPEFRELANAISCFQMSFPLSHRSPCRPGPKGKLEIDLIAAHLIPHMCTILLYEPFGDVTDPTDPAVRRFSSATTAVVSIIQEIAARSGTNADFSTIMHSSASVSLVTAARTSVVLYRQALNIGDMTSAETHRMDIELVRMALAQFGTRFKIGFHHAQLIEYFLDRATNPTLEKLSVHYPEHPRPGAPELVPGADLGKCIINALNIKRGFWRLPRQANSNQSASGISPFGSTPDSSESRSGSFSGSNSTSNQAQGTKTYNAYGQWSGDNSPNGIINGPNGSASNPFITPSHGQGPATGSISSNIYLTGINGVGYKKDGIGGDGFDMTKPYMTGSLGAEIISNGESTSASSGGFWSINDNTSIGGEGGMGGKDFPFVSAQRMKERGAGNHSAFL